MVDRMKIGQGGNNDGITCRTSFYCTHRILLELGPPLRQLPPPLTLHLGLVLVIPCKRTKKHNAAAAAAERPPWNFCHTFTPVQRCLLPTLLLHPLDFSRQSDVRTARYLDRRARIQTKTKPPQPPPRAHAKHGSRRATVDRLPTRLRLQRLCPCFRPRPLPPPPQNPSCRY